MHQRNNFALFFILLNCTLSYTRAQFRVKNGVPIDITESPHSVAILRDEIYACVGSIVSLKSVVTVAHCVIRINKIDLLVIAGAKNTEIDRGEPHCVEQIYEHPNFDPARNFMDLAVAKVFLPFEENDSVEIIPLCNDQLKLMPGEYMHISGWGTFRDNDDNPSRPLKTALVKIKEYGNEGATLTAFGCRGDICDGDTGAGGVFKGELYAVAQTIMDGSPNIYMVVTSPIVRNFITSRMY